ncbi:MAG: methyltransferase [Candidatus Diapherotrites archaeon]|nr:methyltransferase [Candidatus Diapherotrites archaeon]
MKEISFFSEETKKYYKLRKIDGDLPCLEISGIRMHCVNEGIRKSTMEMVNAISPLKGTILDSCFGLGYTAMEIAKSEEVEKVICFEKDKNVLEIAKKNEFSKKAFEDKKIEIINRPIEEGIKEFDNNFFDRILHDPPSFRIAGELYSKRLYYEFYRVLKNEGILFHYVGSPYKKRGLDITKGIIKRLKKVGFKNIVKNEKALGIVAKK